MRGARPKADTAKLSNSGEYPPKSTTLRLLDAHIFVYRIDAAPPYALISQRNLSVWWDGVAISKSLSRNPVYKRRTMRVQFQVHSYPIPSSTLWYPLLQVHPSISNTNMEPTKVEYLQNLFGTTEYHQRSRMMHDDLAKANIDGSVKLALPYEAPNHPPLPSVEDIREALKTHYLTHRLGEFPVCRVGPCVVKFGLCIRLLQVSRSTPIHLTCAN
jgi:hypothetical protein